MPQLGILCLEFEHPLILASEPCPQAPVLLLECGTPTLLLAECGAQGGGCAVVRGGGIHRLVILDSATDIVNPPISSILTIYPGLELFDDVTRRRYARCLKERDMKRL